MHLLASFLLSFAEREKFTGSIGTFCEGENEQRKKKIKTSSLSAVDDLKLQRLVFVSFFQLVVLVVLHQWSLFHAQLSCLIVSPSQNKIYIKFQHSS